MSPSRTAEDVQEEEEFLRLDEFLCFTLYAAQRAVMSAYRPLLDKLGLTYPQYLVLVALYENGPSPVKSLGAALHLDYGTLTPLLKRLEKAGLAERRRRADDERVVEVTLTADGKALRERAHVLVPALDEAMGLSEEELDRLKATLRRLTGNLTAHVAAQG